MSPMLRLISSRSIWLIMVGFTLGLSRPGVAQLSSPARQLGQSSPGFIPSYSLESDKLRRDQQALPVFINDNQGTAPNYDTPYPWWDGAESVAIESTKQKGFGIGLSLEVGWEYDDNPFLSQHGVGDDVSLANEEGGANSLFARLPFTVDWEGGSTSLNFSYNPEFRAYDGDSIDDAFNDSASLAATYSGAKLGLGLTSLYSQDDGSNVEAGDRVESIYFSTALSATYAISPKTSLGASVGYNLSEYERYNSNHGYSMQVFADYEIAPKTQVGIGAGYDKTYVDIGASSDARNLNARFSWRATQKFSLRSVIGCEWRTYDDATIDVPVSTTTTAADGTQTTTTTVNSTRAKGESQVSPIFSLGASYQITPLASLTLDAYRHSTPSISEINQSYYSTGVVVTASQKLYDRFNVSLSGGYENADYEGTVEGVVSERNDDYWFGRVEVSCTIRERFRLAVYYQHSNNDSTGGTGSSFERNLIGVTASYRF